MEKYSAIAALSALGHETRIDIFRLLVRSGADGVCAGEIADAVQARQNTVSTHLGILARAGLIHGNREGRSIRYFADMDGMSTLLDYLLTDCCRGVANIRPLAVAQEDSTARV